MAQKSYVKEKVLEMIGEGAELDPTEVSLPLLRRTIVQQIDPWRDKIKRLKPRRQGFLGGVHWSADARS